jgi:hypothetical protein
MKKIILILLFGFSNCDPYVPYYLNIDNRTTDTIKIVFLGNSPYIMINSDSLIFPPKYKKMLWGTEGHPTKDGCSYTGIKKDEIGIYTFSGKKLRKEIWDIKNWDCIGSYDNGWEQTFIITEDDLE